MKKLLGVLVLSASVLATGCGHSDEEYNARLREIRELNSQLQTIRSERDRLNGQVASLRTSSEAMATRLRELGESVEQTQSALDAARRREEELRRAQLASEARLATFRQMLERFRAMINSGQLRVRIVRGRMVIELPAGILFESGDARLRAAGEDMLRQVAQVLRQIPDRDFLIAGHTDNVQPGRHGRVQDNWELSTQRAANVVRFLQQNGLDATHLGAAGYAEFQAVAENDSEEHRQQNRRVEIILMPNMGELPDLSTLEAPPAAAGH